MHRRDKIALVLFTFVVISAFVGAAIAMSGYGAEAEGKSVLGLSEQQVMENLGPPDEVLTNADLNIHRRFQDEGGYVPELPDQLENKALVYKFGFAYLYVLIGEDGRAEQSVVTRT